jgi:uncharacterized protein (TIGR02453 family)
MAASRSKVRSDEPERFEGFADPEFFRVLAKKQSRDWFATHKPEYEAGFAQPMLALLNEAGRALDRAYPDCELAEPKVFRIHRDVRFSRDKSPYKTHVAGVLTVRAGASTLMASPAALYMHVGFDPATNKEQREAGAGIYMMQPEQLVRYRKAALDAKKGTELGRMLRKLEKAGMRLIAAESTKNPPRGVDPAHPHADLLKMKGLVAMFPAMPASLVKKRALLHWVVSEGKLVAPLVRWLAYEAR